jgi:hypothetical protein
LPSIFSRKNISAKQVFRKKTGHWAAKLIRARFLIVSQDAGGSGA